MKRITEDDIEGSIPADAYAFMKHGKMEIDEKKGVSCGYCEHVAEGLKQAYKHYREEHKQFWDNKIKSFSSEKKVGNKIVKKVPLVDETPQEERHVIKQCATNNNICLIEFDIRVKKEETKIEIPEDVDLHLDLGKKDLKENDVSRLNNTLKKWLKLALADKEKEKEHVYSQNVGDSKMPNVIKKLLSKEADVVFIRENKIGNYDIRYIKKKNYKEEEENLFSINVE